MGRYAAASKLSIASAFIIGAMGSFFTLLLLIAAIPADRISCWAIVYVFSAPLATAFLWAGAAKLLLPRVPQSAAPAGYASVWGIAESAKR